jgi:hypothetical protein
MCGKTASIVVRARGDSEPDICARCYRMPEAVCSVCGKTRECNFASTSWPVCPSCSPRAVACCARCGQVRPPTARWPEGPVCDPCYTTALRSRARCACCGQIRRLVTPAGPDADTCADCAGIPVTHACIDCGLEDKLYEKNRCTRCSLRRRARELLSAGSGDVPSHLAGVFEAIVAARQPRSALNWLRTGAGASLLADIAASRLAATHEALDVHSRQRAADYLRHMLTAGGMLPPRDEGIARAERWAAGVLDSITDHDDRRLIQAYITWHVMRRLRASAGHDHRRRTRTAHARNNVRSAVSLLAWLRGRRTSLPECGQADIDLWLGTGPAAFQARDFLLWAADRGHCTDLDIPAPAHHDGTTATQDHRWAQAARLLHDDSLDLTDRAAGCLLLLYGQRLSRIAAMTASQVTTGDGEVLARLGQHDLPVPEPLAVILTELIRTGRSHTGIGSRRHAMAVPRRATRPADHRGPARPAPAQPRNLRHGQPQSRAHRSGRPTARRRPRRPPPHVPANRGALGTPDRSRLVRLRSRHRPDQQSPALTNTSHATAQHNSYSTQLEQRSLPVWPPGWTCAPCRTCSAIPASC